MKVRVTTLEKFRRVLEGWEDETALVRTLQGQPDPPNELMRRGTKWHDLLRGVRSEDDSVCQYAVEDVLYARTGLVGGLNEVEAVATIGGLQVVGHCDWIRGLLVMDHKAKWSTPDPRPYERSLQWRFYLLLFGARVFGYNLWHFSDPDKDETCRLKGLLCFRFFRYPGLEEECAAWCEQFLEWADARGLIPCLEKTP